MTPKQRKQASKDLTLSYFYSYTGSWRLTKVLTCKKLIENRYEFYKDIMPLIRNWGDNNPEASIAQEIQSGLYHDAIAQCVQYVEDLFALIKATKKPDYFIRDMLTYKAGMITKSIETYKPSREQIIKDFFLPDDILTIAKDQKEVLEAIDKIVELLQDQVKFYKKYWFFYNQYKHGLSVPLRGYGNIYTDEQIEKDKAGEMPLFVATYDNMNLKASASKGTFDTRMGVFMSGFTKNVQKVVAMLEKENNFLRLVFPPDYPDFNIDLLIDQAYKTRACINTLTGNYDQHINPQSNTRKFQLPIPTEYKENRFMVCTYEVDAKND